MAYSTAANAAFRPTGFTHGSTAIAGKIGTNFQVMCGREQIFVDDVNTPSSCPIDVIDARATVDYLDQQGGIPFATAAANTTQSFSEANGSGSGSIVIGKMVPGDISGGIRRRSGGCPQTQVFQLEGALTLTFTQ